MAIQLTAAQQQLIDEVCAGYRRWLPEAPSPPRPLRQIEGGYSNCSVLLAGAGEQWVLRLAGPPRTGVCRHRERRALRAADRRGLCPELRLCDPDLGLLITRYVIDTPVPEQTAAMLATLLRSIHALPWDCGDENDRQAPEAAFDRLFTALPDHHPLAAQLRGAQERMNAAKRLLGANRPTPVLCHNDLLRANRLTRGARLLAIDWEYAGGNDPLFDIAVSASEAGDARSFALQILQHYLERAPSRTEQQRLLAWLLLYRALEALWYALHAPQSTQGPASQRRLERALEREGV